MNGLSMLNQKNIVKISGQDAQQAPRFDGLKWTLVVLLVITGIVANTYFSQVPWAIRSAAGIVLTAVSLLILLQTAAGQLFWSFAKGARVELRKVVWPTRPETIQTTMIVVAMVVFASLVLWGLDTVFFLLVGWLTGQRG